MCPRESQISQKFPVSSGSGHTTASLRGEASSTLGHKLTKYQGADIRCARHHCSNRSVIISAQNGSARATDFIGGRPTTEARPPWSSRVRRYPGPIPSRKVSRNGFKPRLPLCCILDHVSNPTCTSRDKGALGRTTIAHMRRSPREAASTCRGSKPGSTQQAL